MVEINIQFHENKEIYFPGDTIRGDVLLTTSKPVQIPQVELKLKGIMHLCMHREVEIETHTVRVSENKPSPQDSVESDLAQIQVAVNAADRATAVSPVMRTENRETRHDVEFFRKDKLWLKYTPATLRPGVNMFSFEVKLPNDSEITLLPSFSVGSRVLSIEYFIEAFVTVQLWKSINSGKSHKRSFQIARPSTQHEIETFHNNSVVEKDLSVGFWTKESTSIGKLIKYMFGGDTAAAWQSFSVRVQLPQLLTVTDEPYYLQDRMRIEIDPQGELQHGVVVDGVAIEVVSSYFYKTSMEQVRVPILDNRDPWVTDVNESKDITFLISGAKLPQHLAPTLSQFGLSISHQLIVRVALKSASEDGTKQSASKLEITMPLMLSCSNLQPTTTEKA